MGGGEEEFYIENYMVSLQITANCLHEESIVVLAAVTFLVRTVAFVVFQNMLLDCQ